MMARFTPCLVGILLVAAPAPSLSDPAGLYCAGDGAGFLIGRYAGDDAIALRISSWQGMHHCGIEGTATAAPDGWLLVTRGCMLHLREESDAILLAASPRDACAQFCGARADLNGLTFPHLGRVAARPDPSLFASDLGELDPC